MANIRDITGKNRQFTGTDGMIIPSGTQAQRDATTATLIGNQLTLHQPLQVLHLMVVLV
jgi:uncharacterized protein (DUF39 family)